MSNNTGRISAHAAIDQINGACRPHIIAGINGNLPEDWRVVSIKAMQAFSDHANIVVFADAVGPWSTEAGAKVEVVTPVDNLKLADELARHLSARIKAITVANRPTAKFALEPGATMPKRGSAGSSGYDLYAPTDVLIRPGQVVVIHSGVSIELPDDTWEAQIRPRSGMSKRGLWVAIGTVDSDYRGVVGATVINLGNEDAKVNKGDRYAQIVFARVAHPGLEVVEASAFTQTERGVGGFGSTGK